jgi:hypothetical protein
MRNDSRLLLRLHGVLVATCCASTTTHRVQRTWIHCPQASMADPVLANKKPLTNCTPQLARLVVMETCSWEHCVTLHWRLLGVCSCNASVGAAFTDANSCYSSCYAVTSRPPGPLLAVLAPVFDQGCTRSERRTVSQYQVLLLQQNGTQDPGWKERYALRRRAAGCCTAD